MIRGLILNTFIKRICTHLLQNRMWRKNRAPTFDRKCTGVDLNRNYGYAWLSESFAFFYTSVMTYMIVNTCSDEIRK